MSVFDSYAPPDSDEYHHQITQADYSRPNHYQQPEKIWADELDGWLDELARSPSSIKAQEMVYSIRAQRKQRAAGNPLQESPARHGRDEE